MAFSGWQFPMFLSRAVNIYIIFILMLLVWVWWLHVQLNLTFCCSGCHGVHGCHWRRVCWHGKWGKFVMIAEIAMTTASCHWHFNAICPASENITYLRSNAITNLLAKCNTLLVICTKQYCYKISLIFLSSLNKILINLYLNRKDREMVSRTLKWSNVRFS